MSLINFYEFNTPNGYKSIELHHLDLSSTDMTYDCLVVSAFTNSYYPSYRTLIKALEDNCKVELSKLAVSPDLDLRQELGVWLSSEIYGQHFKRIVCIEMLGYSSSLNYLEESIVNLFGLLALSNTKGINLSTIAMPLIGSGNQGIDPESILPVLIRNCKDILLNIASIKKIIFADIDEEKIASLDSAMNKYLKRANDTISTLPKSEIIKAVKKDLISNLKKLSIEYSNLAPTKPSYTISELIRKMEGDNIRIFELGILSRRLVELLVSDITVNKERHFELWKGIDSLKGNKISSWIISYLHTLRIFGNECAHEKVKQGFFPNTLIEQDIITVLFCLNRVVEFWVMYRASNQ